MKTQDINFSKADIDFLEARQKQIYGHMQAEKQKETPIIKAIETDRTSYININTWLLINHTNKLYKRNTNENN